MTLAPWIETLLGIDMTKWLEIEKATLENNSDFQSFGFVKVKQIHLVLKKIEGPEDYLYRVTEWSMNPGNPKAESSIAITGDEFVLKYKNKKCK